MVDFSLAVTWLKPLFFGLNPYAVVENKKLSEVLLESVIFPTKQFQSITQDTARDIADIGNRLKNYF